MTNPKVSLYQDAENLIKEMFWKDTHDASSRLNIPKLIEEKLIKLNAEKDPDYYNHRPGVVHSTSLSKCLRGVIHEMLGAQKDAEPDPRKLGVFMAGNLFEDFVTTVLADKIVHTQREYEYHYKNITLVGRSDYTINDEGVLRVGENKSVHSDSFWMREREGTIVQWNNQIQLQTYLWLERILDAYKCHHCGKVILSNTVPTCAQCKEKSNIKIAVEEKMVSPHGVFSYISKDDCTVIGAPIKYNQRFVDEIILPALDILNDGYTTKNPDVAPLPAMVIFSDAKHQYQRNWLCTYCEYHTKCAGSGWALEASNLVTQRNRELRKTMDNPYAAKKSAPGIVVETGGASQVDVAPESPITNNE